MIELNSNMTSIAAIVVGLLVCYYLWRELKRTQGEVSNLKNFSGKVASYIESRETPREVCVRPMKVVQPTKTPTTTQSTVPETIPETEEKEA